MRGTTLSCVTFAVVALLWGFVGAQPLNNDLATVAASFLKHLQGWGDHTEDLPHKKRECAKIGGTYFRSEGQCLKLVRSDINFQPARETCQKAGGDLWRPNLSDPDLVKNLVTEVPVVLTASNEDMWVGLQTKGGRLFFLDGLDVTDTYFGVLSDVNNGGITNGGCVILDFKDGYPRFEAKGCAGGNRTDFICEFPLP